MSKRSDKLRWRLLAEFSVIVLGVLVALAVDSWVGGRADLQRETQALLGLRADLLINTADLSELSEANAVQVARLEWLRSFPADGSVRFPADSLWAITSAANATGSYAPRLASYEALVSTGELRLIRSQEIQVALAELQKGFTEYQDYRDQASNVWLLTFKPVWHEWIGVDHESDVLPEPPVVEALRDRSFRSLLRSRQIFLSVIAQYGQTLSTEMERLVELIDEELEA
jgi:hypothetical protein